MDVMDVWLFHTLLRVEKLWHTILRTKLNVFVIWTLLSQKKKKTLSFVPEKENST